jgi:ATP-binding cassette, subfamily C, bacterial exporter for protease/lipase
MKSKEKTSFLAEGIFAQKHLFIKVLFFSAFTNFLILAPTLYMLEVYDRVINSRSAATLLMLTLLVLAVYAVMEVLEWVRYGLLASASLGFDAQVGEKVLNTLFEANLQRISGATSQVLSDLRVIREFIPGAAMMAIIDIPLAMPLIVGVFIINPVLGWMSVFGAIVQVVLAWLTERNTQSLLMDANRSAIAAQNYAAMSIRNSEVIEAMGMVQRIHGRWLSKHNAFLVQQASASDRAGGYRSVSKLIQTAQSSLILGVGCWLTIDGSFAGGAGLVIVASALGARVMAPVVQAIGAWRQIVNAKDSFARLDLFLASTNVREPGMPLPAPRGALSVEGVAAGAPGSTAAILRGVSFSVPQGKVVAVVGPTASGKSTLARLLVGVWPAASGKVRLDGVDIYAWNKDELGPYLGYLPQDVELFDGTVADNIARFGEVDMDKVLAAAKLVGLEDLIAAMPDGYMTNIGDEGAFLSGGMKQRIGLARAVYGTPRLVVLDEPNSSLDEAGDRALLDTLLALKAGGSCVVVVTHRTNILPAADLMLVLKDGQVAAYGARDEVLATLQQGGKPVPKPSMAVAKAVAV